MQPRTPRSYGLAVPTGDYPRKTLVPLYMDIHTVHGGATVDGVAQATPRTSKRRARMTSGTSATG
jgi:hypothetical protein